MGTVVGHRECASEFLHCMCILSQSKNIFKRRGLLGISSEKPRGRGQEGRLGGQTQNRSACLPAGPGDFSASAS